ncbi:MAG: hypothetical protein ACOYNN_16025 [Terrimicrobiaceae bacterium]|jgi:hypothetical protein
MDAFEAYKLYLALKNHFTSKTYDYFKYGGRTKASRTTFEKRSDKYFFHKLSKRKDPVEFLVSNFVYSGDNWIGDLVHNTESERLYKQFLKVKESLSYTFSNDLDKLESEFDSNFLVVDGQHPLLLKLLLRNEITIETFVILDELVSFSRKWSRRIEETVVWPQVNLKCKKYRQFLEFDRDKMKKIVLDKFSQK